MHNRNKPISEYGMTMQQLPKRFIDATRDHDPHYDDIEAAIEERQRATVQ